MAEKTRISELITHLERRVAGVFYPRNYPSKT